MAKEWITTLMETENFTLILGDYLEVGHGVFQKFVVSVTAPEVSLSILNESIEKFTKDTDFYPFELFMEERKIFCLIIILTFLPMLVLR